LELERFLIRGERFGILTFVEKCEAQIAFGDRVSRLQCEGFVEMSDGFVVVALGVEREAEVAFGFRKVWIDGECLAELFDGFVDLAGFVELEAAIIEFDGLIMGSDLRLRRLSRRRKKSRRAAKSRRRSKLPSKDSSLLRESAAESIAQSKGRPARALEYR